MPDNETIRRIDAARNILVGKVPDPKSQVEQITIALIYKFMDDMDQESLRMGGQVNFFKAEYAKYSWTSIFDPRIGGLEMLNLYGEALTSMSHNPHLPELFRQIFKNAYLPYRDPETLKLFLKKINEFTYDHSEKLGDAFEYLLSVLGSQGDAGQFRTPRHIIDFMVSVVAPAKNETILDPACGTAGFLISAFKHIVKSSQEQGTSLTTLERQRLYTNLTGYDISPDMVRLSLVNMYLHGFIKPAIFEYDTLSRDDRWDEYADVIFANPPFMSPSGGITPHKRFSIQSNRSEVLFVDYMAEHLTPNGRAAIIVPEGIIFQSAGAYKQLRKYLVEHNYLWAVASLPSGVFQPYSGVKTSILFLDKNLAKKTDQVLFVKIAADGFDLGAQRRSVEKDDLPAALSSLQSWHAAVLAGKPESFAPALESALLVPISKLAETGDYNLSADRYRVVVKTNTIYEIAPIGKFMKNVKTIDPRETPDELFELWSIPAFDAGSAEILLGKEIGSQKKCVSPGDVLISRIIPHIRRALAVNKNNSGLRQIASTEWIVFSSDQLIPEYLRQILVSDHFHTQFMQKITGVGGSLLRANPQGVGEIKIPLPPLDIQRQIVDEIAAHQRIIDGARQVVETWKPDLELELEQERKSAGVEAWEEIELGEICNFIRGPFGGSLKKEIFVKEGYLVYEQYHAINNDFEYARYYINEYKFLEMKRFEVFTGDLLVSCSGTMGKIAIIPENHKRGIINQALLKLTPHTEKIETLFLKYLLEGKKIQDKYFTNQSGVAIQNVSSVSTLKKVRIPLPAISIQHAIVERIEAERQAVEACRTLIATYEAKIQKVISRVWEG